MSISVDGVLNQYKTRKITFCNEDDGTPMNPEKAKQIFIMARYEGKKYLPMGECYRFCDQTGCKGHIISLNPNAEKMIEIENEYKKPQ